MRRPMVILSLLVALSATPLRIAEAASDLARSLAKFDTGHNLEEVDGGVGDESGATIMRDTSLDFAPAEIADLPPARSAWQLPWTWSVVPQPLRDWGPAVSWPLRRHALHQCFLC